MMSVRGRIILQGVFWVLVYVLLVSAPLVILLLGEVPEGREFWRELSVGLAFAGLAMMSLQFVLTARFKTLKAPYGADIVYHFHRQISLVALALILAHPLLLFAFSPETLGLLNLFTAPWRARAGVIAVIVLLVLVGASVWRTRLGIEYTRWRIWHGVLAVAVVVLAMVHVILARHYLDTPWKQALWISYGAVWVWLLVYVRLVKPLLLLLKPYEVEGVLPERGNAWTVVLRPIGHGGMPHMPGQFAWITAWASPFAEAEHPFSISSSASNPARLAFTIKELGDFTARIKTLQPNQRVYVDGPFGHFSVDRHPGAERFVFIAGGVGITPVMGMLRTLADRGDRRPILLVYANRDWESVIFREELDALRDRLDLRLVHVLSDPPSGWDGESGRITRELLDRWMTGDGERNSAEVFVCGPPPMMDAAETALVELGISVGDIHSERFNLV